MSNFKELDNSFNTGTPEYIICPIETTLPYQRTRSGTYKFPWFAPEVLKAGGFFVPVPDEIFDSGKGRPTPPVKRLKRFGMYFRTSKHTRTQPTGEVLKGYYCKLNRIKSSNSLY